MSENRSHNPLNPALSRRELLSLAGRGVASLGVMSFLAACGVKGSSQPKVKGLQVLPAKAGQLVIAQWPLYIDQDDKTKKRPSIEKFTQATGIKVTYKEVIEDNESFFGTVRETLARGEPTGWDLYVITDWLVAKQIRLGYLETLHLDRLPNFTANAGAVFQNPSYDPGNLHSVPWQGGITGIAYNPKLTGREITSFDDLFDPKFKGKVGMFTEMRDTVNLALIGQGVDPLKATIDDVKSVQQRLLKQKKDGIVRAYYGNEYTDALAKGDIWVTIAWSGDIFQLQDSSPDLKFIVPKEGGVLWVDNLVIPKGAAHPTDAHEYMNFVYRPDIAALITAGVHYIAPVPATSDIIRQTAATAKTKNERDALMRVASSPLVYPTQDMESRLHHYKVLDEAEEKAWNDLFQKVIT